MELILLVCLIGAPQQCREEYLPVSLEPIPQLRCLMGAQPIIAQWSGVHPKWRVTRWRCGVAGDSRPI